MNGLLFRTRAAVLWVAVGVAAVGSLLLMLFEPGALEELLAGEMEGEPLDHTVRVMFTALVVFPLVMVGATLLVSDRANRYVNVIAGLALGLLGVFAVVTHVTEGALNGHTLLAGVAGALALLIAGLGVVGLREPSSPRPERS